MAVKVAEIRETNWLASEPKKKYNELNMDRYVRTGATFIYTNLFETVLVKNGILAHITFSYVSRSVRLLSS